MRMLEEGRPITLSKALLCFMYEKVQASIFPKPQFTENMASAYLLHRIVLTHEVRNIGEDVVLNLTAYILIRVDSPSVAQTIDTHITVRSNIAIHGIIIILRICFPLEGITISTEMHLVGSRVFSIALMNGLRIDEQCTVIVIAMHRILTGNFGESTPVVNYISGTFFIFLYNYILLKILTAFPIPPARIAFFIHIGKEELLEVTFHSPTKSS